MKVSECWGLLKTTGQDWIQDKVPRLGAALAFYTVLSLAPLLIIVVAVVGFVFGEQAAQNQLASQIQDLVGKDGATAVQNMVKNAYEPGTGVIATIIGVVMLLLGATGLFAELQDSLNTIWGVQPKADRGVLGIIQDRFLSFAMILVIGFLLLVSLVISAALTALAKFVGGYFLDFEFLFQTANFVVSLGIYVLLFAMIYKILPDAKIGWGDVWLGAAVTGLLFALGKFLIDFYLGQSGMASAYGAAGSLVVLLVWVYYSAQILFGAEFTKVYANKYGSHIVPAANAEAITDEARARQGIPRTRDAEARARP